MAAFILSLPAAAQTDSFAIREVMLKEVVIQQPGAEANQATFTPDKNLLTNTDQLLHQLNGLSMVKRGNYAWEPGIRGLNNGRILTTIDGMAIFGACTDRMDPISSYIEPSNLRSVSISYGAGDNASGNAIGGGLDFKISQPSFSTERRSSGMASVGYDFNGNGTKLMSVFNYSTSKLGINLNGIYRAAENYQAGGGKTIRFSQYEKWNGGIGIRYKMNPHHTLSLNYIRDEGYNIGYPALTMDVLFAKANIMSLTHQFHIGEGFIQRLENKVYYNSIDHAMDDTKRPPEEVHMHMDMPGTSHTKGLLSTATGSRGKHRFKFKGHAYQNKLHAEMTMYPDQGAPMYMLTLPDGGRDYYELSAQDEWQMSPKLDIQSSLSAGVVQSFLFTTEGKEAIGGTLGDASRRSDALFSVAATPVYHFNNRTSGFISGGYVMRAPTLQELYGFYLFNRPDNYDYLGNPLLKKERSLNLSAGIRFRSDHLRASLKAFAYLMDDYIAGEVAAGYQEMTHGAFGVKQYHNIGKAQLYGGEAEVEWKAAENIRVTNSNSFSYGQDEQNNALPMIPPFRSIGKLSIRWKGFDFRPEMVLNAAQGHVSSRYGESASPASTLTNFFVNRMFTTGKQKINVHAGIENIFDVSYYEHNDMMKVLRPGRNISLQASWYF